MQCRCGVEVAVVTAKIANRENMNAWFHVCSAVAEWLAVAVQIFSTPWGDLCHCHRASTAESGCGLHSRLFCVCVVTLDSYQQRPKFPRAGNCDEGQLRKKWTQVVWGCDDNDSNNNKHISRALTPSISNLLKAQNAVHVELKASKQRNRWHKKNVLKKRW